MQKILITGGTGFFGRSVIAALQKSSQEFEALCLYHTQKFEIEDKRFSWVPCDLLKTQITKTLIDRFSPTHCIHLAWHVPPQTFWEAPENKDWEEASLNLFDNFCASGGKIFLCAGTLAEYDWTSGVLEEGKTPLAPSTLYGQCKESLHERMATLRDQFYPHTNILWPRIGYFFGPHETPEKLIPKLIHHIKNDLPIFLASTSFSRPYAHVNYAGNIIGELILRDKKEDVFFHLSAEKAYPLQEIVKYLTSDLVQTI